MFANPYDGFSEVFDRVVRDEKYDRWERWVRSVWKQQLFFPNSLVDIACGTGKNAIRFTKDLVVFGVDSSQKMLDKAERKGSSAKFLNGNFLNFSLPQRVDAAICFDFSINYLLSAQDFVDFLVRVYGVLNDGGIFIRRKPLRGNHLL